MSCEDTFSLRKRCFEGPKCLECPPAPPSLPCDADWGVAVMAYIQTAVVGIATHDGAALGRGFWVSSTVVATAWENVRRESLGVRVIVDTETGQAVPIDGVVVFAVPLLNIGFIQVNPGLLVSAGYTPRVLPIENSTKAGTRVVTTIAPGSFATGFVSNASIGTYGYIADVTTSLYPLNSYTTPAGNVGVAGAPIIHAFTLSTVGMVQYVSGYQVNGVCGRLLNAAMLWAAVTRPCVVQRLFAPGPATIPVLHDTVALGQLLPVNALGASRIPAPLVTRAVQPELLTFPLGDTAYGAWVHPPVLRDGEYSGTAVYSGNLVFGVPSAPNAVTYVDVDLYGTTPLVSMDVGYTRANVIGSFYDISTLTGSVLLNDETGWNPLTLSIDITLQVAGKYIRVCTDPLTPATTNQIATGVYVSALGFLLFKTPIFPVGSLAPSNLVGIINTPYDSKQLYAAPFASADFYNSVNMTTEMLVYFYLDTPSNSFIVQWSGITSNTGDPVSFQVRVTYGTDPTDLDDPVSGQVSFAYAVTKGSWSGSPWLTATTLTSDPSTERIELIPVTSMPAPNDLIYFGNASYNSLLYMPTPNGNLAIVCPSDDTVLAPVSRRVVLPDYRIVRGTVAVIRGDGAGVYAATAYAWPGWDTPFRVVKVNSIVIGSDGVDNGSLAAAVATLSPMATDTAPTPVAVYGSTVSTKAGTSLGTQGTQNLLLSAVVFGTGNPIAPFTVLTTTTIAFNPDTSTEAGLYQSLLLTLPASTPTYYGSALQNNFVTAKVTVTIPSSSLTLSGADPILFIVQLAATNSTTLDTQFQDPDSTELNSCLVVYSRPTAPNTYWYQLRAGYGGGSGTPQALTVVPIVGGLQVTATLTYSAPNAIQRINALVIGRPPRAGNTPSYDDPPLSYVLVPGTVTVDPNVTTTAPMISGASDLGTSYVITSMHGVHRPYGV